MSQPERVYDVLIVSAAEKLNISLTEMLSGSRYDIVGKVGSVSAAQRIIAERSVDMVIVNSPLPDDAGLRFSIDLSSDKGTVVLVIVRAEQYEDAYERLSRHGVFVVSRPASRQIIETALLWLASARERLRKLEKKNYSFEEKMEEIRLVNRAKWLLISELKMDEPAAHRYIEKLAMDRCTTRKEIAETIIRTYA